MSADTARNNNYAKRLREVAGLFVKLGIIGFGGPIVHIAMMQREVVEKRRWMSNEHFLDMVGATNLIPGPNSTEMTMHCGNERAGRKGLIAAGVCFILPAVIITSLFAWAYKEYGNLPQVAPFLYGIKPAIIAVVVMAAITLGKTALKSGWLWAVGLFCFAATLLGANEILVLFGAGLLGVVHQLIKKQSNVHSVLPLAVLPVSNAKLFWLFLKVGSILYGSGYVLFAFLEAELVNKGIISRSQLIDAIAVGQFTPGPVFSAATFVGWQINGLYGAALATLGIFLPSFLFVGLLNPLIPRLRRSALMSAFLNLVNVASVAIILAVCVDMGRASIQDWRTALIAVAGFTIIYFGKHINSAFVVLGGAIAGFLLSFL